jgi:hypothetical protein
LSVIRMRWGGGRYPAKLIKAAHSS